MWIFTKLGFFSAVCAKTGGSVDTEKIMVRARKRQHLESLKSRFSLTAEIIESKHADYRYRILVGKSAWSHIVAELASDINYPNFKDAVADVGRDDYEQALHEVWAIMATLQR